MLWANLHLLFWLSLIPFATGWMGENHFAPLPTALYGVALLMPAIAYYLLQTAHHPAARPRRRAGARARRRLEGQALAAAVSRRHRAGVRGAGVAQAIYVRSR